MNLFYSLIYQILTICRKFCGVFGKSAAFHLLHRLCKCCLLIGWDEVDIYLLLCGSTEVVLGVFGFFFLSPFNHRMNLCTTVTESDVARGKNALKASLVGQLNGKTHMIIVTCVHLQLNC